MDQIVEIPMIKIKAGEHDQRIETEDPETIELAASIGRVGIINPIVVVEADDMFLILSGHRRFIAATIAGKERVPCIVRKSEKSMDAEVTFAENFFRKDLSAVELACAIRDCLENGMLTEKQLAAGFHRSEHWVQKMLVITLWPDDVQRAVHVDQISVSAASNLALVTDDTYRNFLVRNAVEQGATARTTAAWLQAWQAMQPAAEAITAEPLPPGAPAIPMVPQAPCLCCAQQFPVNQMSHVPVCGACIQIIRTIGVNASG